MSSDYARVEKALRYIDDHRRSQPTLEDVAEELGLSPFHTQRLFRRWAGVSPKRFLEYLTVEHAKRRLSESASVLDAALDEGLSGPARLHDQFVAVEAMTPGEYKRGGEGLRVRFGFHPSPFGRMLVAATERGVCGLAFVRESDEGELAELRGQWPGASLIADSGATEELAGRIFEESGDRIRVLVRGTNFQIQVWKALLTIPEGALCSYRGLARALGRPTSARALAGAVAANRLGYLIPCHRVIRGLGQVGGYRWGTPRKRALLAWESARLERRPELEEPGAAAVAG